MTRSKPSSAPVSGGDRVDPERNSAEAFLNDGDSPDIPIPIHVGYLNQMRELALKAGR